MINIILASLFVVENIFGMEIIEQQHHKTTLFIPSLEQLCSEACAHYNLPSKNLPQECRDLIAQYKYYKDPLTKDNLAKILSVAKKRGDANRKEECRNFCKETTLHFISSPKFENDYTLQAVSPDAVTLSYDDWYNSEKSRFEKIIKTTTMTSDPEECSVLMHDPTIQQQRNNYITKRNDARRFIKCYLISSSSVCISACTTIVIWVGLLFYRY